MVDSSFFGDTAYDDPNFSFVVVGYAQELHSNSYSGSDIEEFCSFCDLVPLKNVFQDQEMSCPVRLRSLILCLL